MIAYSSHSTRSVKKNRHLKVVVLLFLVIFVAGGVLNTWITKTQTMYQSPASAQSVHSDQLDEIFPKAIGYMQSGEYNQALKLWHSALLIAPEVPEVKVNLGFSLFETGDYKSARNFFLGAIDQNAFQANAYYGLAIASEQLGDIESAMGAMKSYIHLAPPGDVDFLRKARSALWEWESSLKSKRVQKNPTQTE